METLQMTTNILAAPQTKKRRASALTRTGFAAIAIGLGFNIPYAILADNFDYPGILRQPADIALARFAEGGPALIATWYGFAACAIALIPLAVALSITAPRLATRPALAIGAAITGALAGLVQAIGLLRWVFAVPLLAEAQRLADANPVTARAASLTYSMLNAWGGVAIGEHLGQILTALFAGQLALLQRGEGDGRVAAIGLATAATLVIGSAEGPALAMGGDGAGFAMATIVGFLGLTAWLVLTGLTHRNA
jgi:Domain of unknown function (DUF4386)